MPALTPSFLYTFIAMIAVSTLLVASFMVYTNALRTSSEAKRLQNLIDIVAAKGTELLTLTLATNASAEAFIEMPTVIGEKQYWMQLHNDSSNSWLEGGLGNTPAEGAEMRVYLLTQASVDGSFVAGFGPAHLKCEVSEDFPHVILSLNSGDQS